MISNVLNQSITIASSNNSYSLHITAPINFRYTYETMYVYIRLYILVWQTISKSPAFLLGWDFQPSNPSGSENGSVKKKLSVSHIIWLVVSPYPSEKYEFVSWDDDIPNMIGKINFMFQTTNQSLINKDPRDAIVVQELCRAAARNNLTATGAVRLSGSGGQGWGDDVWHQTPASGFNLAVTIDQKNMGKGWWWVMMGDDLCFFTQLTCLKYIWNISELSYSMDI